MFGKFSCPWIHFESWMEANFFPCPWIHFESWMEANFFPCPWIHFEKFKQDSKSIVYSGLECRLFTKTNATSEENVVLIIIRFKQTRNISCDKELQHKTINYQDIDVGFPNVDKEFALSVQLDIITKVCMYVCIFLLSFGFTCSQVV